MSGLVQYPWRTRLGWECRGYMYYVDVCESECLDVARGLWLTGADYVCLHLRGGDGNDNVSWRYHPTSYRGAQVGGYSER